MQDVNRKHHILLALGFSGRTVIKPMFVHICSERPSEIRGLWEISTDTESQISFRPPQLTVSGHGPNVRPVHDALVLLSQGFNVALAEVQYLLPENGAVLVAGPLLDGEVQQHHAPDEAEADQEEAQLLGGQLPQEGRRHADSTEGHGDSGVGVGGNQEAKGIVALSV